MNKNISKKQAYSFNTSNNFKIELPEDVSFIINTIEKNGHQAYAVGGCVRDTITGISQPMPCQKKSNHTSIKQLTPAYNMVL